MIEQFEEENPDKSMVLRGTPVEDREHPEEDWEKRGNIEPQEAELAVSERGAEGVPPRRLAAHKLRDVIAGLTPKLVREQPEISGEGAFELYATYGFPLDLTQLMAREYSMTVDIAGYDHAMAQHRELSSAGETFATAAIANLPATDDAAKYSREPIEAKVLGWVVGNEFIDAGQLSPGDEAAVVLDRTNFYGEQGGQVGDAGVLRFDGGRFAVRESVPAGQCVLHVGVLESSRLAVGQAVTASVDASRFDTMRNHTATHLLNWALRKVLGDHVNQAGSVVAPDRLRFDFTHNQAVTDEQIEQIERLVNERVLADEEVLVKVMPLDAARKIPGVRAVFGEKYPDPVRVMLVGAGPAPDDLQADDDRRIVEFCGGTHLERTSQAGLFKILTEESVAKGVRRITAITGAAAVEHVQQLDRAVRAAARSLRITPAELPGRVEAIQKELKKLKKAPKHAPTAGGGSDFAVQDELDTPEGKVLIVRAAQADAAAIRNYCDVQRQKGAAGVLVGAADEGKVVLIAMVSEKVVQAGKCVAGDWVKAAAAVVGGTGGGKPTLAQAGGKQPEKLPDALAEAADFARRKLG